MDIQLLRQNGVVKVGGNWYAKGRGGELLSGPLAAATGAPLLEDGGLVDWHRLDDMARSHAATGQRLLEASPRIRAAVERIGAELDSIYHDGGLDFEALDCLLEPARHQEAMGMCDDLCARVGISLEAMWAAKAALAERDTPLLTREQREFVQSVLHAAIDQVARFVVEDFRSLHPQPVRSLSDLSAYLDPGDLADMHSEANFARAEALFPTISPPPTPLPSWKQREHVVRDVAAAIEAKPSWMTEQPVIDELMASEDVLATLLKHMPDAEYDEAFAKLTGREVLTPRRQWLKYCEQIQRSVEEWLLTAELETMQNWPGNTVLQDGRYRQEFPHFGELDVQLPIGWADASWHNDSCPSFTRGLYTLFIEHSQPSQRSTPAAEAKRFSLAAGPAGARVDVFETDDWYEMLACLDELPLSAEYLHLARERPRDASHPSAH